MTRTKSTFLALLAVLLSPMAANAVPIVDYPLDPDAGFGWGSNRGAQQVAELFTVGTEATAGLVSWYGFWDTIYGPVNDEFDILFFADVAGTPDTVAFASETVFGLVGTPTGSDNGFGYDIFEWSAAIAGVPLLTGDYWISIRGAGPELSYVWSHSFSDGSGTAVARFADDGAWEEIGVGTRDLQTLRIEGIAVPEPGTLALLGIGLLGMAAGRRRNRV